MRLAFRCNRVDWWNMQQEIPYDRYLQLLAYTSLECESMEPQEVATAADWARATGQDVPLFSGAL